MELAGVCHPLADVSTIRRARPRKKQKTFSPPEAWGRGKTAFFYLRTSSKRYVFTSQVPPAPQGRSSRGKTRHFWNVPGETLQFSRPGRPNPRGFLDSCGLATLKRFANAPPLARGPPMEGRRQQKNVIFAPRDPPHHGKTMHFKRNPAFCHGAEQLTTPI